MPQLKIDHVVSFSSEDPNSPANNILSEYVSKKWKCKTPGEKNAVIVLQLEKASQITAIDIGNEHSAYIEVLVSRSGTSNEDYKVLLVMSAFMTPVESRNSQNPNKVRMFTKDQLSKPECEEKWDRIKIVCTQPFNKHVQYGLSFINFHTSDLKTTASPKQTHIGKFIIRPESPDNLSAGSLFTKRKELKQDEKLTGAAAIRDAASSSSLNSPLFKPKLKINSPSVSKKENGDKSPQRRNRDELLYSKEEEEPNEKIDKILEKVREDEEIKRKEQEKAAKHKKEHKTEKDKHKKISKNEEGSSKKRHKTDSDKKHADKAEHTPKKTENSFSSSSTSSSKKRKDKTHTKDGNKKQKMDRPTKPFEKLLEGVTLVISGIQNPDRANLRNMALSLGSKYKSDWDNTCTHLICAFPNTPKFNQVKGKGKIVKRSWIEDCHSQRKRLPWRRYALDKNDAGKNESEDEIWEQVASFSNDVSDEETNDYDEHHEEASDTEERLSKLEKQKTNLSDKENAYLVDTDKDDFSPDEDHSLEIPKKLPDLFDSNNFYIDHNLDQETYNKLLRYIVGYKGTIVDDLCDDVDIIVTNKVNSDILKEINSTAKCVSANWVWECHNNQQMMPIKQFLY